MKEKIKVVQMGLGPIGNKATRYLLERKNLEIVGAIDADPAKVGQDVGTLAGLEPIGVKVTADIAQALGGKSADVVLLTTSSALGKIADQLRLLLPSPGGRGRRRRQAGNLPDVQVPGVDGTDSAPAAEGRRRVHRDSQAMARRRGSRSPRRRQRVPV